VKLVTWNVNSLKVRLPRVLELLAEHRPDVLCLQETKCAAEAFPHAELAEAGYAAVEHSAGRWAGVAILAPTGVALGDLRVASVYVPNGRAVDDPVFADKLRFLDALAQRAPALDLLAGDLNVTRTDEDVYDPAAFAGSTHVTPDERERLEALIGAGLDDAFRRLTPEGPGFTWWDYRQGHFHRKMGLRIDYLLMAEPVAARLRSCGIDRDYRKGPKPSDHAPLLAELG
jgi:exodeoxyribonuclease-3